MNKAKIKKKMKTKQEILKETKTYLNKTAKHLFKTVDGFYYTIQTFEKDEKLYITTIFMGNNKIIINTREAISDTRYSLSLGNSLNVLQNELFPNYFKTQSIPFFKKMKSMVNEIILDVSLDNKTNTELASKFKDRLLELEKTS